ncbi:MAG: peptidylprolyl isomerase, FKBP-type, partial [Arthrobacter sp.]|nr:peptidylprolyl isomerase, FKBP-type [Arthrobacter sp.]
MSFGQRNFDRQKPEIDFPEGDVPTELVITDLIEGDGAE